MVSALQLAAIKEATPNRLYTETTEDEHAVAKARERRSRFNFSMVDIPPGSTLTFSRDRNIICTVHDNKSVTFEGEITSLSAAALKALHRLGYNWTQVQGPQYWQFEDETLEERRQRMEEAI